MQHLYLITIQYKQVLELLLNNMCETKQSLKGNSLDARQKLVSGNSVESECVPNLMGTVIN